MANEDPSMSARNVPSEPKSSKGIKLSSLVAGFLFLCLVVVMIPILAFVIVSTLNLSETELTMNDWLRQAKDPLRINVTPPSTLSSNESGSSENASTPAALMGSTESHGNQDIKKGRKAEIPKAETPSAAVGEERAEALRLVPEYRRAMDVDAGSVYSSGDDRPPYAPENEGPKDEEEEKEKEEIVTESDEVETEAPEVKEKEKETEAPEVTEKEKEIEEIGTKSDKIEIEETNTNEKEVNTSFRKSTEDQILALPIKNV